MISYLKSPEKQKQGLAPLFKNDSMQLLVFATLIPYRTGGLACGLTGTCTFPAVDGILISFQIWIDDRGNVFFQSPNPLPLSTWFPSQQRDM